MLLIEGLRWLAWYVIWKTALMLASSKLHTGEFGKAVALLAY